MIRHVIFDLGQVLIGFQPKKYLQQFSLTADEISITMHECFQTGLWDELDRGTYTYAQAADIIGERHPSLADRMHTILGERVYSIFTELPAGSDFLKWCREEGFDCYYLTNFGSEGFHYVNQTLDFFKYFNGGTASYEIRSIKPEPDIYKHFLSVHQLAAEQCVFIDDNAANVTAARQFGMHGIVCDTHEHVYRAFEQLTNKRFCPSKPLASGNSSAFC